MIFLLNKQLDTALPHCADLCGSSYNDHDSGLAELLFSVLLLNCNKETINVFRGTVRTKMFTSRFSLLLNPSSSTRLLKLRPVRLTWNIYNTTLGHFVTYITKLVILIIAPTFIIINLTFNQ